MSLIMLLDVIIHQRFSLARDWSKRMTEVTEYSPTKTGEYHRIFPKCALVKIFEVRIIYKHNSLHLALKICSDIWPWT